MSKATAEATDVAGETTPETPEVASAATGRWEPTPVELRQTALHLAASIRAPGHTQAKAVLEDAQMFYAFLAGE